MGDKIDLSQFDKPKKKKEPAKESAKEASEAEKRKRRKRIVSKNGTQGSGGRSRTIVKKGQRFASAPKAEPTEEEVQ